MFCGGAVALYSLVGSDPLAHNRRTKLLVYDSKPPPAASSDLTEYIATRVWFRAKCCFHVFHTCTREVAPDRPADFTVGGIHKKSGCPYRAPTHPNRPVLCSPESPGVRGMARDQKLGCGGRLSRGCGLHFFLLCRFVY